MFDNLDGYTSPINVEISQHELFGENAVVTVVQNLNITVDKAELVKALAYDRKQYQAGYAAGYKAAMEVRE